MVGLLASQWHLREYLIYFNEYDCYIRESNIHHQFAVITSSRLSNHSEFLLFVNRITVGLGPILVRFGVGLTQCHALSLLSNYQPHTLAVRIWTAFVSVISFYFTPPRARITNRTLIYD